LTLDLIAATRYSPKMALEEKSNPVAVNLVADSSSESGQSNSVIKAQPQKKFVTYFWDTFDKSPEERAFLFKLDAAILTFASLGIYLLCFPNYDKFFKPDLTRIFYQVLGSEQH
jgi:hypothetical protein